MSYLPIIGISGNLNEETQLNSIKDTYFNALLRAGAMPVLIPRAKDRQRAEQILDHLDALLLAGGADIHPSLYGEELLECCGKLEEERDQSELLLIEAALERRMPIFGICRGVQILAVALGCTLFQDIEAQLGLDEKEHRQQPPYTDTHHAVRFKEGGLFERITQTPIMLTNSMHHQSIKQASDRLMIEGITMDGIIEAVSMAGRDDVLGVQFHPECLVLYSDWAARLFDYFVDKAQAYHQRRL